MAGDSLAFKLAQTLGRAAMGAVEVRPKAQLALLTRRKLLVRWTMGYFLTETEREALWGEEPREQVIWESPDVRAQRYESALRGILACAGDNVAVWMVQAVAATALGEHETEKHLLERIRKAQVR